MPFVMSQFTEEKVELRTQVSTVTVTPHTDTLPFSASFFKVFLQKGTNGHFDTFPTWK